MQKLILHSFALLILLTAFVNAVFPDIPDIGEGGCVAGPNPCLLSQECQKDTTACYKEEFCEKTYCCKDSSTGLKTPVNYSDWIKCNEQPKCKYIGETCTLNDKCCIGSCELGRCCRDDLDTCISNDECCGGYCSNNKLCEPMLVCRNNGGACTAPAECCSGSCDNNVCSAVCKNDGLACSANDGCCSNNCIDGVCRTPTAEVDKTVTIRGKNVRVQIAQNVIYVDGKRYEPGDERLHITPISELPTGVPIEGVGITFGQNIAIFVNSTTAVVGNASLFGVTFSNNGESCKSSGECASGRCASGKCASVIVRDGSILPPSQNPSTAIVVDRKVPTTLSNLFGWTKSKRETSCIRGAQCTSASDCCGAQCSDGYCLCGVNACSASGECCSGYCEGGQCRTSPTMSSFLFSKPLQGCAGLVEECLPGEGSCVAVCGGLTILMLISAVGSGFVAWQRFAHPNAAVVAAVVPILVGLATYSFVGIIAGLVIIVMISYLRGTAKAVPLSIELPMEPQPGAKRAKRKV